MCSYAEMYALIYQGDIKGYRIYAVINDKEFYYDFQTENISLDNWTVGSLKLKRHGGYLLTDDELAGKYKPIQITAPTNEFKELINQVKYYYELRKASR